LPFEFPFEVLFPFSEDELADLLEAEEVDFFVCPGAYGAADLEPVTFFI
jgi:hypothetical protein